jgi:preprotein translocase subunit SecE
VARDRQRAKQRKQRQAPQPPSRDRAERAGAGDPDLPEADPIHRDNVPGPWEHGGEVDQVEAAIVAGAGGEPADDPDAADRAALGQEGDEPADGEGSYSLAEGGDGGRDDGLPPVDDAAPDPAGGVPVPLAGGEHAAAGGKGITRFGSFLKASWAELQRVQWPDRRQVGQATAVVLGFVLIAGAFLGFADYVANEIVELIL